MNEMNEIYRSASSAEGAEYKSPGQARSASPWVKSSKHRLRPGRPE